MADEFQICGGYWWNSTPRNYSFSSSPCSSAALNNDIGSYGIWSTDHAAEGHDLKTSSRSSCDQETACSTNQMVVVDSDKTLHMLGFGLSSSLVSMPMSSTSTSSDQWNQALIRSGGGGERSNGNYNSMLEEDMNSRLNFGQEMGMDSSQIQKDWSPKSFSTTSGEDSSIPPFKQITQAQQDFSIEQQEPQPRINSANDGGGSTADYNTTCQGLSSSFPMCSSPQYSYAQPLLQGLFEPEPHPQPNIFDNRGISYATSTPMPNYRTTNLNDISSPNWINRLSPLAKPSLPKQVLVGSHLHFSNNTAFWNASATPLNDIRASFFPSQQSQLLAQAFEEKSNCQNFITKPNNEDVRDTGSMVKKSSNNNDEPVFKRPRIETPSPLPTFKVRKEKLGDRITALQQLVSPFGKTDTASVLHEAIEYIKFLHDQVNALSTPYMKNGTTQHRDQQALDKLKHAEGSEKDLRSRGLCLVPISSTYPVANETTADFWTPTFGGTFR
ncbi:hypothetical protein RJ641_002052 [Dillenia turbinata]|uniref:BHLH domain-containing protein n=1 Tax=Dillenia turbinata TaxID=194707 RepID=A0AAN8VR83_9MAGN